MLINLGSFSDLEEKLKAVDARVKLIVTDGVFSMDGNVAPLGEIVKLAKKYNALTFIDECHATGFFGKTGRSVTYTQTLYFRFSFNSFSYISGAPKNFSM
jgi:7-keto-8-aminopelargonate synthetase-like enzyme